MRYIITFISSFIVLTVLDFVFLGVLVKDYYQRLMSPAINIEFNLFFAFLFYFTYTIGLFIFVLLPNIDSQNIFKIFIYGALFGFFCYMTYDFTNAATIKNWPTRLVFIDILWGSFITGLVSVIANKILEYF